MAREAVDAGAVGVSTSRTFLHRSSDGRTTPTHGTAEEELHALAGALLDRGRGIMQLISDLEQSEEAFACMRRLVERSGPPLSFSLLEGHSGPKSARWCGIPQRVASANAAGLPIRPQVIGGPVGRLLGHELTLNPFYSTPAYASLSSLVREARVDMLCRPENRARVLAATLDADQANVLGRMVRRFEDMYLLGGPPDYEPAPQISPAALAARQIK